MSTLETMETLVDPKVAISAVSENQTLRQSVQRALQNYFAKLGDNSVTNLYEMVLAEVEAPLLEIVLQHTKGNQSKAAILLGLSRGTLRKKLAIYDLDNKK